MIFILDMKDQAIKAIRSLCAFLCEAIYPIIGFAYNLFIKLATFELMTPTEVQEIYKRVIMVLTIIMVFYIVFEFIKYIIQPDLMTDKEKGVSKLPLRMLAVVVLIAFVPNFFIYANKVQNTLVKNEVLTKIILGKKTTVDTDYNNFGKVFAWDILTLFYYEEFPGNNNECDGIPCASVIEMNESNFMQKGTLTYMTLGINSTNKVSIENGELSISETTDSPNIHFDAFWAVLVGGFIAYMLILYCVDVAARVIQIVYLQIIAPIPIVGILSPKKDNIFSKWLKQCATTYLDVFVRLAIINFVLLISSVLINSDTFDNLDSADWVVKIALILGLLVFAKRVPKMIGELFPSMGSAGGNFGLKPGDRNLGRLIGAALGITAGTVTGAASGLAQGLRKVKSVDGKGAKGFARKVWAGATGAIGGVTTGTLGGFGRGLANGAKKGNIIKNAYTGAKNQMKASQRYGAMQESGYTLGHRIQDTVGGVIGASRKENLEKEKAPRKRRGDMYEEITKLNKERRQRAEEKVREGKGRLSGSLAAAEKRVRDFKEDPTVKAQYMKRRMTVDGTTRYDNAKQAAANAVDKNQFKIGKYSSQADADAAYETAKQAAESAHKIEDYKVGYKDQATADAEYEKARREAAEKVDMAQFRIYGRAATKEYQKAVKEAQDKVKREDYVVGKYATQAEAEAAREKDIKSKVGEKSDYTVGYKDQASADAAYNVAVETAKNAVDKSQFEEEYFDQTEYERDYQQALQAADDAKKQAINDYIDYGAFDGVKDDAIVAMDATVKAKREEYNRYSAEQYKVSDTVEVERGGTKVVVNIDDLTADEFDKYVKKTLKAAKDENEREIIRIDSDIAAIDRETSSSGKKS